MKKLGVIVVVIILIVAGGYFYYRDHKQDDQQALAPVPAVYINVAKVATASVPNEVSSVGSLLAWQQVEISPEIGEIIKAIYFKGGQHVTYGQPLFLLDNAIYQAAVNSSGADLKAAKAKYDRYITLRKTHTVAEQDYDNVVASYQTKLAAFNQAKVNLAKMQLTAPFSGTISTQKFDVGQYVNKGTALATLVDSTVLKLAYALPQAYTHDLKIGQTVTLTSNAVPGKTFYGKLYYIAPSINPETRTLPLEARVMNKQHQLSPGMFVQAKQILSIKKNALVIPETAILPSIAGPTVYVIKDNRAHIVSVTAGVRINDQVEITQGLSANQLVAISGLLKLKDGALVNAKVVSLLKARS